MPDVSQLKAGTLYALSLLAFLLIPLHPFFFLLFFFYQTTHFVLSFLYQRDEVFVHVKDEPGEIKLEWI